MENVFYPILIEIFNHLPLGELVKNRQVCKYFKETVDKLLSKRDELILFVETLRQPLVWFFDNEAINLANVIVVNRNFVSNDHFKASFKHVKRLLIQFYFKFCEFEQLDDLLNQNFASLEHLQMYPNRIQLDADPLEKYKSHLCLNKLRTLFVNYRYALLTHLNCERLEKLCFFDAFCVDTNAHSYAKRLKYLIVNRLICTDPNTKFPELEILVCSSPPDLANFRKDCFPNLGELHVLDLSAKELYSFLDWFKTSSMKDSLSLYVNGVKYERSIEDKLIFVTLGGSRYTGALTFYNEHQLELKYINLKQYTVFYTDKSGEGLNGTLDKEIFKSINNQVEIVNLSHQLFNFDYFIGSRVLFEFVNWLNVTTDLSAAQLDALPDIFPFLKAISFKESKLFSKLWRLFKEKSDQRYLLRFKYLHDVQVNKIHCFSTFKQMIKNCKYLKHIGTKKFDLVISPDEYTFKTSILFVSGKMKFSTQGDLLYFMRKVI